MYVATMSANKHVRLAVRTHFRTNAVSCARLRVCSRTSVLPGRAQSLATAGITGETADHMPGAFVFDASCRLVPAGCNGAPARRNCVLVRHAAAVHVYADNERRKSRSSSAVSCRTTSPKRRQVLN